MKQGKVYLVGAGPGDPGLITKKALECLAHADVVVYDRLIGVDIPALVSSKAEQIYVGKASADHTMPQNEINRLLVKKAKEGKIVVRLKGGDPFVFGRGGEEAEELVTAGIPFEVVPGISSSVAVPAYAGIPVTHRGVASSFAVITGHEDPGKDGSAINWSKLATAVDTLVFLMGMANLPEIVQKLVSNGRPATTSAAVVREGTTPRQAVATGTLADIVAKVKLAGIESPAIIIVGNVVKLREKINWFDNRPLFGKKILVTRTRQQAGALVKILAEKGANAVELPMIEVKPGPAEEIDRAIASLSAYDWVVFTSANGVEAFFDRLSRQKRDAREFADSKVAAIGPATAEALTRRGIRPDLLPEIFTTQDLLNSFVDQKITGSRMLLARADIAEKELSSGLRRLGNIVDDVTAYVTTPPADLKPRLKEILAAGVDVITFTSSSTVTNFMQALDGAKLPENVKIACIGPVTADTARAVGLNVDILATEQTIPGLVEAVEGYYGK